MQDDPIRHPKQYDNLLLGECITVRDYFAAAALCGLLANSNVMLGLYECDKQTIVSNAYTFANIMLRAKEQ